MEKHKRAAIVVVICENREPINSVQCRRLLRAMKTEPKGYSTLMGGTSPAAVLG